MNLESDGAFEAMRIKTLKETGISFSIVVLLPILLSLILSVIAAGMQLSDMPDWYLYLSYLFPQIALATAAGCYYLRRKEPLKHTFTPCRPRYFFLAFFLQFGLLFALGELNDLFISLLELIGYRSAPTPIPSLEGWALLPAILVIALLPSIFEELFFRGILTRNFHGVGWGLAPVVLLSGALFSLYHGNPEQTVYQFLCGMCFALVSIRAGSIYPTMLAHFCNNAVILILTSFFGEEIPLSLVGNILLYTFSALALILSLVFLIFFEKRGNRRGELKNGSAFFLTAGAGIAICAVEWIVALVRGFVA